MLCSCLSFPPLFSACLFFLHPRFFPFGVRAKAVPVSVRRHRRLYGLNGHQSLSEFQPLSPSPPPRGDLFQLPAFRPTVRSHAPFSGFGQTHSKCAQSVKPTYYFFRLAADPFIIPPAVRGAVHARLFSILVPGSNSASKMVCFHPPPKFCLGNETRPPPFGVALFFSPQLFPPQSYQLALY